MFWKYYLNTHTSARNFTGTVQIMDSPRRKSCEPSFEYLLNITVLVTINKTNRIQSQGCKSLHVELSNLNINTR